MLDLNTLTLAELYDHLRSTGLVTRLIELARDEDLGPRGVIEPSGADVTSSTFVLESDRTVARIVCRGGGIVAGLALVDDVLHAFRADADLRTLHPDGSRVAPGTVVGELHGRTRAILSSERTILNFLGRLSGVATRTGQFAQRVAHTRAQLFDTRKTTPGMRVLEKYAVRCGGGFCHRLGLYDAVLIKDNHLASVREGRGLAGAVSEATRRARDMAGPEGLRFVMVEVDRPDQLRELLSERGAGADIVLLDNMSLADLQLCVQMRDEQKIPLLLEASGGVTLETIAHIAQTGVDRISVGGLTHGSVWLDVALDRD